MTKKKFIFYLGHPAHFHLFKNVIRLLTESGDSVRILIKKKDVLENLLKEANFEYTNIMLGDRGDKKWQIAISLLKRDFEMLKIVRKFKPDLMIGTSAEITHIGKFLGIPSVVVNEDDCDVVPLFCKLAYPFATKILAPNCCRIGKWESKKIGYEGYHELAYLHPNNFTPNPEVISKYNLGENYFLIRLAKLNAHHDEGRSGISKNIAQKIINRLLPYGKVWITAERELEPEFEPYRISFPASEIHHVLAYANLYIGDSQTMAAESAVLGIPSIRFNDFVGEISYLEELENEFMLGYGIKTKDEPMLLPIIEKILNSDYKEIWKKRKEHLLENKIDVNMFMYNLFKEMTN